MTFGEVRVRLFFIVHNHQERSPSPQEVLHQLWERFWSSLRSQP